MKSSKFDVIIAIILVVLSLTSIIWFVCTDIKVTRTNHFILLLSNLTLAILILIKDIMNYERSDDDDDYSDLEW